MEKQSASWSTTDATRQYQVDRWGGGYFSISENGNMIAQPLQLSGSTVPLIDIIQGAAQRGVHPPFVIRLQDILRHRVDSINRSFLEAIEEGDYRGTYRGVFPIKVNHLREVVEEIMDAGKPYHFGLEVGSKPELVAALAIHEDPESLLICNGYKDESFIRLALSGIQLGKRVILVIEKLEELERILEISQNMRVRPQIGIRIRLETKGEGKWATSSGVDSKFGLNTTDLVCATTILQSQNCQDCLKLIHFHVGSQISNIATVGQATLEVSRYYAKLRKMGFSLDMIDVGGGLAVDYDGSRTTSESSMNYTLGEYTRKIVNTIAGVCAEEDVPHPHIVSESGRALVAHHSILIVEAFSSIRKKNNAPPPPGGNDHKLITEMAELAGCLDRKNRRETLHEAFRLKSEAVSRFELGILELGEKACVEQWYWYIAGRVAALFPTNKRTPQEIRTLRHQLGDQYLCNFSIFQSLIDYWAVGQLFPIAPIQRLDEIPENEVTLVDITCDSDGKINRFVQDGAAQETLALHELIPGEPYHLGVFLVGAYQDVMGDIHNLFGPVPETHVFLDEDEPEGFYIEEIVPGNTVQQVLDDVQYEPRQLIRLLKKQVDQAIRADQIQPSKGMELLRNYEAMMKTATYLHLHSREGSPV